MIFNQNLIDKFSKLVKGNKDEISNFRYPGEMLERYQEKGWNTENDKISMLYAYALNEQHFDDTMFVGTQKDDFIREMKSLRHTNKSIYIRAFLYLSDLLDRDAMVNSADMINKKECIELMIDLVDFFYDSDPHAAEKHGTLYSNWYDLIRILTFSKPDLPKHLREILPVQEENLNAYKNLIILGYTMSHQTMQKNWRRLFGALKQLLYNAVSDKSSALSTLQGFGYTYEEILDLNCGAFEYTGQGVYAKNIFDPRTANLKQASYTKFMKLLQRWIRARILSTETVPQWVRDIFFKYQNRDMEKKVNGTKDIRDLLFLSIHETPANPDNALLLFQLCAWDEDAINDAYMNLHPFGLTINREFMTQLRKLYGQDAKKSTILFSASLINEWRCHTNFIHVVHMEEEFWNVKFEDIYEYPNDRGEIFDIAFYLADLHEIQADDMPSYIIRAYLSSHYSKQAFVALQARWNAASPDHYSDFANTLPDISDYCEKARVTDEDKKAVLDMNLELAFQCGKNYLQMLVYCLSNDKIRALFSPQEAEEIYDILSDSKDTKIQSLLEQYAVHEIFLSENQVRERKEKQQEQQMEAKRAKLQERRAQLHRQYMEAINGCDTITEKLECLFDKNQMYFPSEDMNGAIYLETIKEVMGKEEKIPLSQKGLCKMLATTRSLFFSGAMSFNDVKHFIDAFEEKGEANGL